MTEREFDARFQRLRAATGFDAQDRRGALNHLTPERVAAAASGVRSGLTVSLASDITTREAADAPAPARHTMTGPIGPGGRGQRLRFATDHIALNIHDDTDSHIDALCHVIYDDALYNGVSAATVTAHGAEALSIEAARDGIVGRGVLLDIPHARGVPWLDVGDHVSADDLLAAERTEGIEFGAGDILLVRVGHHARRRALGPWRADQHRAGLHPDAMDLLAERRIAALGSDGNNDTAPSCVNGVEFPVHVLAINALGLHLMDYLQLEDLHRVCTERNQWSFLCVVAPLRLPSATGSPVNPIAVF